MSGVVEARAAVTAAQREVKRKQTELSLRIYEEVCVKGRSQASVARELGVTPPVVAKFLRRVSKAPRA